MSEVPEQTGSANEDPAMERERRGEELRVEAPTREEVPFHVPRD